MIGMGSIKQLTHMLLDFVSFVVFKIFDLFDSILCIVYSYLDVFFEGNASHCYCSRKENNDDDCQLSETLFRRPNSLSNISSLLKFKRNLKKSKEKLEKTNRWSDCGCASCVAWMNKGDDDLRLHVVVQEPDDHGIDSENKVKENVIFLHGFMASSSFWTQTVFPNFSEDTKESYRLLAVDLLGFGESPKPRDCLYTLEDQLKMIEKSVVIPFKLNSFHLVAHSMGCIIAVALAAKYSHCVKTITLVSPPYFPCPSEEVASLFTLRKLAPRSLWPPIAFGISFMSWYEHLGRTVCFIICRNHRFWEFLLRILTCTRNLNFSIMDSTKHTHHSAWHTMHNVICGSAKSMDEYLQKLSKARVKFTIIQGDEDQLVPLQCSYNIKIKVPEADVRVVPTANHTTVVLSRTNEFTLDLETIWMSFH